MSSAMLKGSVWAAMNYTPPRGRCNHKTSLMSPACPCLRFMLHPIKAASSFECDGCSHHASFHSLENPAEDAIRQKWLDQEAQAKEQQAAVGASKKRKTLAQNAVNENDRIVVLDELDEPESRNTTRASRSSKVRAG
ncbi:hypothetical protein Q7P35_004939 [Cladosporium inversicolor]